MESSTVASRGARMQLLTRRHGVLRQGGTGCSRLVMAGVACGSQNFFVLGLASVALLVKIPVVLVRW